METTRWPLVVLGVPRLIFPFLFSPKRCRGLVIPRGLGTLSAPRFPSTVGSFLLLVLDVRLGLEEEAVEHGRCLNSHSFGKVTAGTEPVLKEMFLHVIGR